jgi:hypothetical protein
MRCRYALAACAAGARKEGPALAVAQSAGRRWSRRPALDAGGPTCCTSGPPPCRPLSRPDRPPRRPAAPEPARPGRLGLAARCLWGALQGAACTSPAPPGAGACRHSGSKQARNREGGGGGGWQRWGEDAGAPPHVEGQQPVDGLAQVGERLVDVGRAQLLAVLHQLLVRRDLGVREQLRRPRQARLRERPRRHGCCFLLLLPLPQRQWRWWRWRADASGGGFGPEVAMELERGQEYTARMWRMERLLPGCG